MKIKRISHLSLLWTDTVEWCYQEDRILIIAAGFDCCDLIDGYYPAGSHFLHSACLPTVDVREFISQSKSIKGTAVSDLIWRQIVTLVRLQVIFQPIIMKREGYGLWQCFMIMFNTLYL